MGLPTTTMSPAQRQGNLTGGKEALVSDQLLEKARSDTETVLGELESRPEGLSQAEADSRLKQYGLNEIAREKRQSALMRLLSNVKNPLVLLLTALGVLSFLTGDLRATAVIFGLLRFRVTHDSGRSRLSRPCYLHADGLEVQADSS
jgi:P-type Mg2+ transporter